LGKKVGDVDSALNELGELIKIYSNAIKKIGHQQAYFQRVERALEEAKNKCDALASLKDDDFEFIRLEFPKQVEAARAKLQGLSKAVKTYLTFLKEKGIFFEVPDIDKFDPF
jgi:DNA repair exonuclease SbcCD ATPase subunit